MAERDEYGRSSMWSAAAQHAGWGLTIALSIGLFLWLGLILDRRLGTLPLLTIVGSFVGGAAGFYSMFRRLVPPGHKPMSEDPERDGSLDRSDRG
jgi:F0F1-type ATP synthase assembly protein I